MSTPLKIWVTRAEPMARRSVEQLTSMGYEAFSAPLLRVEFLSPSVPEHFDGLIFSSQSAIRAFCDLSLRREIPVWCVGESSAALARHFGFDAVQSADGDVKALFDLMVQKADRHRHWLYPCAKTPRAPLTQWLGERGFSVESLIVYETHGLRPEPQINLDGTTHILVYSPKGAFALGQFLKQDASGPNSRLAQQNLTLICLSKACAESLSKGLDLNVQMAFNLKIAQHPHEAALLARLSEG